jgi:hypothetical protein
MYTFGAYQKCGWLFKDDNKVISIEEVGGEKTKWST